MRNNKYNVSDKSKRMFYGKLFDSKAEGEMYLVLKSEEEKGNIKNLRTQIKFILQEAFIDAHELNHKKITYSPDFVFYDNKQKRVRILDAKGYNTDVFKLKKKMFNYRFKDQNLFIEDHI